MNSNCDHPTKPICNMTKINSNPQKRLSLDLVPSHLGDIMSSTETANTITGNFTPLQRIVLTANGNLQRILSAFFNSKVSVIIIKNDLIVEQNDFIQYDRQVHLVCLDKIKCVADSIVTVTDCQLIKLIKENNIGIGQLFRYLNLLPEFKLLEVSKSETGFSRKYTLQSPGILCELVETFQNDLFNIELDGELKIDKVNETPKYQAPL
ncbi:hypothetical protein BC833DRAFT_597694 [Globomyces pollinis-pini]|nr:hypothetical protein BC833DRAFT_597694 [Globomyces pollinis-pini]